MSNDNKNIHGNIFENFVQRKIGKITYLISLLIQPSYAYLIKLKKMRRIKDRISIMAILQKVWNVR